jgi:hypothetical protein
LSRERTLHAAEGTEMLMTRGTKSTLAVAITRLGRRLAPLLLGTMIVVSPAVLTSLTSSRAQTTAKQVWNFDSDTPGAIAKGFTSEVGHWEVVKDGGNQVLAQKAKSEDATFNVALAQETSYKDVDLSVRVKAVAGEIDRGGGLIWRAKDKGNYYICRYNPLEDNYRVYKVENGKRTQFASAKVPGDEAWHTLRATMAGSRIACYLDGKKLLEAEDSTFPGAGKIGLWSKADARTYFDDLTVTE